MIINNDLLKKIKGAAEENLRLRMNFNFHESLDSKAQRLINVLLPGTKIPIHRHKHTDETYILIQGKMYVIFYNERGEETERFMLDPTKGSYGIHIPKGQWHGIDVINPSAIFEVKDGPYAPLSPEDIID